VIVLIIDHFSIGVDKPESDSPIATNPDGPGTFARTLEGMKPKAWKTHVLGLGSGAQPTQDQPQPFSVPGLNARLGPGGEELGQPFVLEASNHDP